MTGAVPLRPHLRSNSALEQMRRELVLAFHILNREGQGNEVAGHVTARLPGARTFWHPGGSPAAKPCLRPGGHSRIPECHPARR